MPAFRDGEGGITCSTPPVGMGGAESPPLLIGGYHPPLSHPHGLSHVHARHPLNVINITPLPNGNCTHMDLNGNSSSRAMNSPGSQGHANHENLSPHTPVAGVGDYPHPGTPHPSNASSTSSTNSPPPAHTNPNPLHINSHTGTPWGLYRTQSLDRSTPSPYRTLDRTTSLPSQHGESAVERMDALLNGFRGKAPKHLRIGALQKPGGFEL